jgi:hypothetical protein
MGTCLAGQQAGPGRSPSAQAAGRRCCVPPGNCAGRGASVAAGPLPDHPRRIEPGTRAATCASRDPASGHPPGRLRVAACGGRRVDGIASFRGSSFPVGVIPALVNVNPDTSRRTRSGYHAVCLWFPPLASGRTGCSRAAGRRVAIAVQVGYLRSSALPGRRGTSFSWRVRIAIALRRSGAWVRPRPVATECRTALVVVYGPRLLGFVLPPCR